MKKNIKLLIEYDGKYFHGWQRQKSERTVQEEIEKVLKIMTGKKITLTGSGRTDAGVHALGQTANFICHTKLDDIVFYKGLNSLLPVDIIIKECVQVNDNFHARFNVKSKIYLYSILNRHAGSALYRNYSWFIRKKLDLESMNRAIKSITGTFDFKAFEGAGSPRAHTIRTIFNARMVKKKDGLIIFEIEGDGFLRYMVRNIMGTLVDVGHHKITSEDFNNILLSKKRTLAGKTAPPQGLYLMKVKY